MNRMLFYLPLLLLLLAAGSATAARIYTIDPETGETTVTEPAGEEVEPVIEEKPAACPEDEKELRRLREIARRQQQALLAQQALITRLRAELRRQENIIQGLDQLRRQGR